MDEAALAHLSPPEVPVGEVVATGRTAAGLVVALEGYDESRRVETPSPYEHWPEGDMHMPPLHGRLLVVVTDAAGESGVAGSVSWHAESYGPTEGSFAWNIGIGLAESCRGHGVGTVSQRLLGEWLLAATPLVRIEASTDVTNVAEQKALERAGYVREGVLRQAQARADGQHDIVVYSLLRADLT